MISLINSFMKRASSSDSLSSEGLTDASISSSISDTSKKIQSRVMHFIRYSAEEREFIEKAGEYGSVYRTKEQAIRGVIVARYWKKATKIHDAQYKKDLQAYKKIYGTTEGFHDRTKHNTAAIEKIYKERGLKDKAEQETQEAVQEFSKYRI